MRSQSIARAKSASLGHGGENVEIIWAIGEEIFLILQQEMQSRSEQGWMLMMMTNSPAQPLSVVKSSDLVHALCRDIL